MYSGHTCVLTSAALFILEYSPKRWWIYHYLVSLAAIVGVISIGIAHEVKKAPIWFFYLDLKAVEILEKSAFLVNFCPLLTFFVQHYSIDIIAAYYVCTHHFWTYHLLASNQDLKNASKEKNHLKRVWWWRIFLFMEGNTNPIPRVHLSPITKIRRFVEKIRHWLFPIFNNQDCS